MRVKSFMEVSYQGRGTSFTFVEHSLSFDDILVAEAPPFVTLSQFYRQNADESMT